MTPIYSPFFDPDWCATVHVVPFDPEEDRRRQVQEIVETWNYEHRRKLGAAKGILGALAFTLCAAAAIFALACL